SKLFGGGGDAKDEAPAEADETYKDVEIRAVPQSDGGQWRVGGTITKDVDGAKITRTFLRADLMNSREEAAIASVNKAKLIIDQNGAFLWKGDDLDRPV
ncbi:MAG: HlyU family transcriptional regulator, partial [Pseudomonadota bacterium]